MKARYGLCLLLAHLATLTTLSTASSQAESAPADSPCPGGPSEDAVRALEEDVLDGGGRALEEMDYGRPIEGKRVGFSPWGGKRSEVLRAGALTWGAGREGGRTGSSGGSEEASKRVGFNAWGGKRSRFNSWGGKRGSEVKVLRSFNPWGGKRDGGAEGAEFEDDDSSRGSDWGYSGQVEESPGNREGSEGDAGASWGRPFGRGRRSPSSTRSRLVATVSGPTVLDEIPWERKRLAALWRAANLQPARQNRRSVGADFFPWGGKRSSA